MDRTGPVPLWMQIKDWMVENIRSGRWPEHLKLPAEEDLAEALGVSRGTLRRAVRELVAAGVLNQVHGKGTFVAGAGIEQPLAQELAAFSELLDQKQIPYVTRVLRVERSPAPERAARLLKLGPEEPVVALTRVRVVEGVPVAYLENYVPARLAPGLESVDFSRHGLFTTLEGRYGLTLVWGQRTFEAVKADPLRAEYLQTEVGAALLYVRQVVYLPGDVPVEYSEVWLRGDHFRLSAVVQRRPAGPQRAQRRPGERPAPAAVAGPDDSDPWIQDKLSY